jgi:hypothetical protein
MATRKAPAAPAPVAPVVVAEVVMPAAPATLDTLTKDIRDLASVVRDLVGALTPMLVSGKVTTVAATKKIATTAPTSAPKAGKELKHRAPVIGESIEVGDQVSIPVGALKGKCGEGLGGIVTGTVLSLGSQVAKNRGDMPAGLSGTVLTIKLSKTRNVWAWSGDPRVALTGKKIVETETTA